MGGEKKGDKKGDSVKGKGKGEFGYKGEGGKGGEYSDFAGAKKGDKKGDKKGGDKKGGKGGPAVKLPLRKPPALAQDVTCRNYVNAYMFTEKAPSVRTRQILGAGERPTDQAGWDALRDREAAAAAKEKDTLTQRMDGVPRLGPGTGGEETEYIANVLPVLVDPERKFYQYAMQVTEVSESGDGRLRKRSLEKSAAKLTFYSSKQAQEDETLSFIPASSGICFTNKKLDADDADPSGNTVTIIRKPSEEGRPGSAFNRTFKLVLKLKHEIPTKTITQETVTLFSCIFRQCMEESKWQKIGRTYFDLSEKEEIPRMGKALVPGLYAALHSMSAGSGIGFTVDCVKKCVAINDAWTEAKTRVGADPDLRSPAIQRQLNTMFVDTVMMSAYDNAQAKKRTVHIDEVKYDENEDTPQPNLPDSQSLKQYFEAHYGLTVPKGQPVLLSKNSKRRDPKTGEPVIEKYLPSVLMATGCPTRDPKTKPLREQMLRMCAVKPNVRYGIIKEMLMKIVGPGTAWEKYSKMWGFDMQKGFSRIQGRSMPKPTLVMSKNWRKDTSSGAWNFDIDKRASNPNPTTAFYDLPHKPQTGLLIVCPKGCKNVLQGAGPTLERAVRYLGDCPTLKTNTQYIDAFDAGSQQQLAQLYASVGGPADAIITVADQVSDDMYRTVKCESIITAGKPSQVVREQTIGDQKKLKAVCNKLATQILTKLGNAAWVIDGLSFKDVMVCGISFHHAGSAEGRRSQGSVAGIAASLDEAMSHYTVAECHLAPGTTVAAGLAGQFHKCLRKYKKNNGKAPKYFVFFREGGSEGETPTIVLEEVQQIKEAIREATGEEPRIAYFLVLRQSHVRLAHMQFASEEDRAASDGGRSAKVVLANPSFGAMVDQSIVHMKGYEFFLVSQKVDQGSATAVKYKCLINDLPQDEWTSDAFQKLAFSLCNMYYNWNGPIAVPAPCLYASRHARMFGDQLTDAGGQLLEIKTDSKIHQNDCLPCL